MIEILNFAFTNVGYFFGTIVLMGLATVALCEILASFKPFQGMIVKIENHDKGKETSQ